MHTYQPTNRYPQGGAAVVRALTIALAIILGMALYPPEAGAQSLDAVRAAGQVGEGADGYAVLRQKKAPAAVKLLVANANSQRRKIYAKRASEQRVPAKEVGRLYAAQIAAKAPKGTWIQNQKGGWRRK